MKTKGTYPDGGGYCTVLYDTYCQIQDRKCNSKCVDPYLPFRTLKSSGASITHNTIKNIGPIISTSLYLRNNLQLFAFQTFLGPNSPSHKNPPAPFPAKAAAHYGSGASVSCHPVTVVRRKVA